MSALVPSVNRQETAVRVTPLLSRRAGTCLRAAGPSARVAPALRIGFRRKARTIAFSTGRQGCPPPPPWPPPPLVRHCGAITKAPTRVIRFLSSCFRKYHFRFPELWGRPSVGVWGPVHETPCFVVVRGVARRGAAWLRVARRGVAERGAARRKATWRGVVW